MDNEKVVGSPPIYSDADSLRSAVDEYFRNPPTRQMVIAGEAIEVPNITVTGLCISLGFASRQSFYDYEKREKFSYIIKRARLFIENDYESLLKQGQCTGAIFALKNMGWSDKLDIEQQEPQPINITIENPHAVNSTD